MDELDKLDDAELKNKLVCLKEDLEDSENEKRFVFKQSGMHVSSSKVAQEMAEYNDESLRLQKCIDQVSEEIKRRGL
ncbi:hypothetical protein [Acetobacterium sp.]|uniref:hypothetical protein n=1 Tax=Acetobacterium sp. TaxID=1872094 RepID=UPI002F407C72